MNFIRTRTLAVIALILCAAICTAAFASTPEPPAVPRDYVTDLAGIIRPDVRDRLNGLLGALEQKTTAQVLVLTVQSLDGQSIEEFALSTKERWKLGQKGKDNGVLLVVAVKDRKYRFEVGYGLESVLPDSMVGSIGREYLVPSFRQGDYGGGVSAAVSAVVQTIAASEGVSITGMPEVRPEGRGYEARPLGAGQVVLFALFALVAVILFITHPRQCMLLMLVSSFGGRGGWSGGGGGGFGGFGGGSFGGGGGGSGGGGGASGGW